MKTIMAGIISLDGKIARGEKDGLDWVGTEEKGWIGKVCKESRAVVIGRRAYESIGHYVEGMMVKVMTRHPEKYKGIEGKVEFTSRGAKEILVELFDRGFRTVIIGGGRETYSEFVSQGLVGEVWALLSPVILGKGISWMNEGVAEMTRFRLICTEKFGSDSVVVKYRLADKE